MGGSGDGWLLESGDRGAGQRSDLKMRVLRPSQGRAGGTIKSTPQVAPPGWLPDPRLIPKMDCQLHSLGRAIQPKRLRDGLEAVAHTSWSPGPVHGSPWGRRRRCRLGLEGHRHLAIPKFVLHHQIGFCSLGTERLTGLGPPIAVGNLLFIRLYCGRIQVQSGMRRTQTGLHSRQQCRMHGGQSP